MTPSPLELEHHAGEPLHGDLVPSLGTVILADLVVLTIDTSQVAVAKENVAGALSPRETGLLAEVGREGGDDRVGTGGAGGS